MEAGYSKWRKLDNAALGFSAGHREKTTRECFRFYCELKEDGCR